MQWINSHGTSVYFDVTVEALLRRAQASKKPRPLFAGMGDEERSRFICQQLAERSKYYNNAKIIFPADNPDVDQLVRQLKTIS